METRTLLRRGAVAVGLLSLAMTASGDVYISGPWASVSGVYWDLTVVPSVYRVYSHQTEGLPMDLAGELNVGGARLSSALTAWGRESPESGPQIYSVVGGEGWASLSSVLGPEVDCEASFRSNFAMTVPGWIELQTWGLGVIELRNWRGIVFWQVTGDRTSRLYLDSGIYSIAAVVDIENTLSGEGGFRFVIPTPATSVLLAAGVSVLASGRRRRCR